VYLGYNPHEILSQPSRISEELQSLTSFAIHVVSSHFIPIPLPMGMPLEINAAWYQKSIELQVVAPLPFELFNLPSDYDEEVDMTDYLQDDECEVIMMEDAFDEDIDSENIEPQDDKQGTNESYLIGFVFDTLDVVIEYTKICQSIKPVMQSSLYKHNGYWLICDFSKVKDKSIYLYPLLEWCGKIEENQFRIANIKEHGECMIEHNSFNILSKL
jgi:negative regulator of genetic competence, sporulation and motility